MRRWLVRAKQIRPPHGAEALLPALSRGWRQVIQVLPVALKAVRPKHAQYTAETASLVQRWATRPLATTPLVL